MSNNQIFKVYTSDATISPGFPFHISRSIVSADNHDIISLVSQEHSHEFMQMLYVVKGKITNEIGHRCETLLEGELVILPPFVKHRNDYYEGAELFTVSFMPSLIDSSFDTPFHIDDARNFNKAYFVPFIEMAKDPGLIKKFHFVTAETVALKNLFWSMFDQFTKGDEMSRLLLHANFVKALALVAKNYLQTKEKMHNLVKTPRHKHYEKVHNVIQYVQKNFHKDLKINDVIAMCNLSSTYFRMIFKEITGKPFVQYLNELRIYHAIVLIKKSTLNLSEIADEVGFAEFQNFHRTFKKIIGCSPSAYRRSEGM